MIVGSESYLQIITMCSNKSIVNHFFLIFKFLFLLQPLPIFIYITMRHSFFMKNCYCAAIMSKWLLWRMHWNQKYLLFGSQSHHLLPNYTCPRVANTMRQIVRKVCLILDSSFNGKSSFIVYLMQEPSL